MLINNNGLGGLDYCYNNYDLRIKIEILYKKVAGLSFIKLIIVVVRCKLEANDFHHVL